MEIEVNRKEVDLRYIFGMLILWIGASLVVLIFIDFLICGDFPIFRDPTDTSQILREPRTAMELTSCLLYTSPSPRD